MCFVVTVLLFAFFFSCAKICGNVEYEFKQYKSTFYGWGAKKGCFAINVKTKETQKSFWNLEVLECSAIKKNAILFDGYLNLTDYDDENLEKRCNNYQTCMWKGGKCKASSCPSIVKRNSCYGKFKNGKCEKFEGDDCLAGGGDYYIPATTSITETPCNDGSGTNYYCPTNTNNTWHYCIRNSSKPTCRTLIKPPCSIVTNYYWSSSLEEETKYTKAKKNECEYKCAHPPKYKYTVSPYQYTVPERKFCHKQLGCLYDSIDQCSVWSIWAFVLTLVLSILFVVGVAVAAVVVLGRFVFKKF